MKKTNGLGVASLILGIAGLLFSCIAIGIVPAIIGLVLGMLGLRKKDSSQGTSIAGVVCSSIAIIIFVAVLMFANSGSEEEKTETLQKVGEVETQSTAAEEAETQSTESEEVKSNVFHVGDVVETKYLKISFISAEKYESENEFLQPKEGYEYWRFEFKFENISDADQYVSSMMDWECYADNSKVDQTYLSDDNGLDATLSSGRTTQGAIYFEVPTDSESIELEYDINFWQSDKIIFVGK